jgi:hypothetical protein
MIEGARYVHTNLIARDWRRLAAFYQSVFGCIPVPPERNLSGPQLEAGTGVPGSTLAGMHLRLPGAGADAPTLEIFSYSRYRRPPQRHVVTVARGAKRLPKCGRGRLAGWQVVTVHLANGARSPGATRPGTPKQHRRIASLVIMRDVRSVCHVRCSAPLSSHSTAAPAASLS